LEPLLFYVLHRASVQIAGPNRLGTFKLLLLDEAWLFIKNETVRSYIVSAQKTWRKHNAAMILATQSIKELEESGMIQTGAKIASGGVKSGLLRCTYQRGMLCAEMMPPITPTPRVAPRSPTRGANELGLDDIS